MGNVTSSDTITVLCKCRVEMISTTPAKQYKQRITCCSCNVSIAPQEVLFHCNQKSNPYHKGRYDLCESCSKRKALKVHCTKCKNVRLEKVRLQSKHNYLECNQCKGQIVKNGSNSNSNRFQFIYQCTRCHQCTVCMKCVLHQQCNGNNNNHNGHHSKHTSKSKNAVNHSRNISSNGISNGLSNGHNPVNGPRRVRTTLHGYDMIGPFVPHKNMVWYCDHKSCQYTKHGLYRKYRIENWKSSKFGKKFVLCDGCVRQYEMQPTVQVVQPVYIVPPLNVQVDVNCNVNPRPSAPEWNGNGDGNNDNGNNGNGNGMGGLNGSYHLRSDTEIMEYQPEGVSQRGNATRTMTTFM